MGSLTGRTIPEPMLSKSSVEDLQSYLRDLLEGTEEWREMKLLVLGHGRIGKTTLIQAIQKLTKSSGVVAVLKKVVTQDKSPILSTVGVDTQRGNFSRDFITVSTTSHSNSNMSVVDMGFRRATRICCDLTVL